MLSPQQACNDVVFLQHLVLRTVALLPAALLQYLKAMVVKNTQ